jgi:uncharacterized protein (TIGR02246 family)
MKGIALALALMMTWPLVAVASPRDDALSVIEKFKKSFDAGDVQALVNLFAPDAILLGTTSPKIAKTRQEIEEYFQALTQFTSRSFTVDNDSAIVLSNDAVLFAGFDTFVLVRDGKTIEVPARFTFVIAKTNDGWQIAHFHSSMRPKPQ